jgi:hypothetical protein
VWSFSETADSSITCPWLGAVTLENDHLILHLPAKVVPMLIRIIRHLIYLPGQLPCDLIRSNQVSRSHRTRITQGKRPIQDWFYKWPPNTGSWLVSALLNLILLSILQHEHLIICARHPDPRRISASSLMWARILSSPPSDAWSNQHQQCSSSSNYPFTYVGPV